MKTFQVILSGKKYIRTQFKFWSVKICNLSLDLQFDIYQVYCILLLVTLAKRFVKVICRLSQRSHTEYIRYLLSDTSHVNAVALLNLQFVTKILFNTFVTLS